MMALKKGGRDFMVASKIPMLMEQKNRNKHS